MDKQLLEQYLNELSQLRPIFHSEADFQHELACLMKTKGHEVRLEKPFVIESDVTDV